MTRVLLGGLVVAMLALTGLVTYHSVGPAVDPAVAGATDDCPFSAQPSACCAQSAAAESTACTEACSAGEAVKTQAAAPACCAEAAAKKAAASADAPAATPEGGEKKD
jgi:hypothetical protein